MCRCLHYVLIIDILLNAIIQNGRYAQRGYVESSNAKCGSAECRFAGCHGAMSCSYIWSFCKTTDQSTGADIIEIMLK
jgi:hypothetical protein